MNTRTSLICAAVIGLGFLTAAQAASFGNASSSESSMTVAEMSSGKTGRIAIPVPRPDPKAVLMSDSGVAETPVLRTQSGIRIVGAPFFSNDAQ